MSTSRRASWQFRPRRGTPVLHSGTQLFLSLSLSVSRAFCRVRHRNWVHARANPVISGSRPNDGRGPTSTSFSLALILSTIPYAAPLLYTKRLKSHRRGAFRV